MPVACSPCASYHIILHRAVLLFTPGSHQFFEQLQSAEAWIHTFRMDMAGRSLQVYFFHSLALSWNFLCSFLSYCREANLHPCLHEGEDRAGSSRCSVNITKNKMHQGYFGPLINSTTQAHIVNNFYNINNNKYINNNINNNKYNK